jgi:thioredoxin-related protein
MHCAMKIKLFNLLLLSGLLASLAALPHTARAADALKSARPKIYNESANGPKLIADATAAARQGNKRVLLQFGANWCGWCHKLHKLFDSDQPIRETLKGSYVVALIDVNKGHNADLIAKYGAERLGLPFLVVLDADGKHLATKNSAELEEGDHHSPQKVLAFLKQWTPPTPPPPKPAEPKPALTNPPPQSPQNNSSSGSSAPSADRTPGHSSR